MTETGLATSNDQSHLEHAYALDREGEYERALVECEQALALDPLLAEAHNLRGLLLEELDRKEEALVAYDQALALEPDLEDAVLNRVELVEELLGPRLLDAWALLLDGDAKSALGEAEAAVALDPGHAPAHNLRGLALAELGRRDEAAASYQRALDLDPTFRDAATNLAELPSPGEPDEQRSSLAAEPAAEVSARRGRRWAVVRILLALVILLPPIGWVRGIVSREMLAPGGPQVAEEQNARGLALHQQGDLQGAVEAYTGAIEASPQFVAAHYNRGLAYYQLGALGQAVADMRRAAELAPDAPDVHATLGVFLQEQGERQQAVESYDRALDLEPGYAPAYYYRALAFIEVNALGSAIEDLESFLDVSSHPEWRAEAEQLLQSLRAGEGLP